MNLQNLMIKNFAVIIATSDEIGNWLHQAKNYRILSFDHLARDISN